MAWATVNIFSWPCVSDLQGFSRGLWICHCGERCSRFKMPLSSHRAAWCGVFKWRIYRFKGGGDKKGKNARENNISFAQRPVSRMITLLTQFYFLKLYNVHSRPTKANSPTRSSSRQRGWKTEFANQFFSGSSSSLLCRGRIVFKNNFHMRPDSMIAAGVVKSWMSSLLLTECS